MLRRAEASDWVVDRFSAMREALNATGRPILFSLCEWGVADPWLWAPKVREPPVPPGFHFFKNIRVW